MLARCLETVPDVEKALRSYEATRLQRTTRLQLTSRQNTWGTQGTDPGWVYGYDVWQAPIADPDAAPPPLAAPDGSAEQRAPASG